MILVDHLAVPLHGIGILFVLGDLLVVFFGHLYAVVEVAQPNDFADGVFFYYLVDNGIYDLVSAVVLVLMGGQVAVYDLEGLT